MSFVICCVIRHCLLCPSSLCSLTVCCVICHSSSLFTVSFVILLSDMTRTLSGSWSSCSIGWRGGVVCELWVWLFGGTQLWKNIGSSVSEFVVSNDTCEWGMSYHTCEWGMSYHTSGWGMWRGWDISHLWMSHVTPMNNSCHTYEWVMSHLWMSHVTPMNESCHT